MFQTVHHQQQQQGGSGAPSMVLPHHHQRLDSFPHHGSEAGNLMELLVHATQSMGNNVDLVRILGENVMGKAGPSGSGGVAGSSALDLHHRHHHHHHHRPGLHQQNLELPRKSGWADPTKGASPSPALWMLHDHAKTPELPKLPLSMLPEAGTGRTDERAGGSRMPTPQQPLWCPIVEKEMGTSALPRLVVEQDRPLHSEMFGLGMDTLYPRGTPNDTAEGDVEMVDPWDCRDHNLDEHEEKNVCSGHTVMGKAASKNLVSERKRRKKLNEGLYTLRSLVPRICKMDKASIIGDAIDYVQDLQKQVEILQLGISEIEASTVGEQLLSLQMPEPATVPKVNTLCPELDVGSCSNKNAPEGNVLDFMAESAEQKILELHVSRLEDQIYHLQIFCTKGPGVFVQLMQTLEALGLEVINANQMSLQDKSLNIFIAEIKDWETMKTEDVKKVIMDVASRFGL